MIDTKDNVRRLPSRNELHVWFPPPGCEDAKEPMTWQEGLLVVLLYAASLTVVCMAFGYGYRVLSSFDWASAWAWVMSLIDFSHVNVRPQ